MSRKSLSSQHPRKSGSASPEARKSPSGLCRFIFADGRSCRMLRAPGHKSLCVFHAREERELRSAKQAARRLVSFSGEFTTASDVNRVLGQLFLLLANQRISRKDAISLAYVAQLLLQSLPHVRMEIEENLGSQTWRNFVRLAHDLPALSGYSSPRPPAGSRTAANSEQFDDADDDAEQAASDDDAGENAEPDDEATDQAAIG